MPTNQIINDVPPKTQIIATNGQTVFNADWTAASASDVLVYARATGIAADDATQLVSSNDYNVTFVGGSETVRVTFLVGRALDDVITLVRATPAERLNLYGNTNLTPSMLNQDTAILTLVDQERQLYNESIAPRYNVSETLNSSDVVLPGLGANQIWAKNPTNTAFIPYDVPADGSLAPGGAQYIIRQANTELPNAQVLGALASGFVVNTTTTGVLLTRLLEGIANQTVVTNANGLAGNPTVGIASNPVIPGTAGMGIPQGTTAERVIPVTGIGMRFNTDTNTVEAYISGMWQNIPSSGSGSFLPLSGGTMSGDIDMGNNSITNLDTPVAAGDAANKGYVDSFIGSYLQLTGGTMAGTIDMNNNPITNLPAPVAGGDAANKNYVDTIAQGITVQGACLAATTANLAGYTYNNGTSGVGATLTAGANGAFSTDGVSPALNSRILVKNQSTAAENGIYTLTQVGDGSNPAILTRSTDYNQIAQIQPGDLIVVNAGTTLANSSWLQTATVAVIGTDAINFSQFTASLPMAVPFGGTGLTTLTPYSIMLGGTTATGVMQQVSGVGNAGEILTSQGAGAPPIWQPNAGGGGADLSTVMLLMGG
jgi:hypothetical protein